MGSFFSSPNRSDRGDTGDIGSKLLLLSCPAGAILEFPDIKSSPRPDRATQDLSLTAWKNVGCQSLAHACAISAAAPDHLWFWSMESRPHRFPSDSIARN